MKVKGVVASFCGLALFVSGCASTQKVAIEQPGDDKLTCEALKEEFGKLDKIQSEADENKSVNTKNVAAAILFWPALAATYVNATDAEKLLEKRRAHLMSIYKSKGC